MQKPNFLIIGAMKAGTTLLYDALDQHPEIYMSAVKEPHYFSQNGDGRAATSLEGDTCYVHDLAAYWRLFAAAGNALAVGEASTSYLHTAGAAERIHDVLPAVKIICVLRNPIERAYSHFLFLTRQGIEPATDFTTALALEEQRIAANASFGRYKQIGRYAQHLQPYLRLFSLDQIRIYLLEDLVKRQAATFAELFTFLGVRPDFVPDTSIARNPSGIPKHKWLNDLISKPNPLRNFLQPRLPRRLYKWVTNLRDRNLAKPAMAPEAVVALAKYYRSDIEQLQVILDRDLSSWLRAPAASVSTPAAPAGQPTQRYDAKV